MFRRSLDFLPQGFTNPQNDLMRSSGDDQESMEGGFS